MEPSTLVLRLMVSSMDVVRPLFTRPVSVLYSSTPTIRLRLLPVFSVSRLMPGAEAMLYLRGLMVVSRLASTAELMLIEWNSLRVSVISFENKSIF